MPRIEVVRGDITTVNAEVLVTAANSALAGGGGVDGAIHRATGPELLRALRPLAPCPPGSAVITAAFELPAPARHVVHAVDPRYGVDEPADDLLASASAYLTPLRLCEDVDAASVAFPALSTGAFGFPLLRVCQISVTALLSADTHVDRCTWSPSTSRRSDSGNAPSAFPADRAPPALACRATTQESTSQ